MSSRPDDFDEIEHFAQALGRAIGDVVPQGHGFALLVFTMGGGGGLTYVSNAGRADMVLALRECAEKLEAGIDTPPYQPFTTEH